MAERLWGLLTRAPRWGLSRRGKCVLSAIALSVAIFFFLTIHSFLAVTERVNARILIVEGWVHDYAIKAAAKEFVDGSYQWIIATGGPVVGSGGYTSDFNTGASVAAGQLQKAGVPAASLRMAPSRVIGRDRTYYSAVALRQWLTERKLGTAELNVLTEGTHARRTWFLFKKAFGKQPRIGIIAVPNPDYDAKQWWRSSDGVRAVIDETIAYLYVRLFF